MDRESRHAWCTRRELVMLAIVVAVGVTWLGLRAAQAKGSGGRWRRSKCWTGRLCMSVNLTKMGTTSLRIPRREMRP